MAAAPYLCVLTTLLVCLKICLTAPVSPEVEDMFLSKKLKALSKLGEGYVEQEVKKALLGIKETKKIVEKNKERHENILTSLRKTKQENEEAVRLFQDISEKLSEAEFQCKQLLTTQWDVCRVCLEQSCMTFYTNSCSQQGLQALVIKQAQELWSLNTKITEEGYTSEYRMDVQQSQSECLFNQILSDVGVLFNKSMVFFTHFQKSFDESFQKHFLLDVIQDNHTTVPDRAPVIISDYFEHWDFSSFFQGLYEFGQTFFEAMRDILDMVYKNFSNESQDIYIPLQEDSAHLKLTPTNTECNELQNSSGCHSFQEKCQQCYETVMKDCPDVIDIHFKSEAVVKLVNVSAEQYEDVLQLAQRHNEETLSVVRQMKEKYGWVAEHTNLTFGTDAIFSIHKVSLSRNSTDQNVYDSTVEVTIFTSPNVVIRLPANANIDSPEVIQYIAERALEYYKNNF
ncbi:clusterin-like protein 1 [Gastrophryne carolinensis]